MSHKEGFEIEGLKAKDKDDFQAGWGAGGARNH
jgi:hypothetical protein